MDTVDSHGRVANPEASLSGSLRRAPQQAFHFPHIVALRCDVRHSGGGLMTARHECLMSACFLVSVEVSSATATIIENFAARIDFYGPRYTLFLLSYK